MPQKDVKLTIGRTWDFLEPAMVPDYARTDHVLLLKPGGGSLISYRKGQVLRQKNDGTNEWAKQGTGGYGGPARILKYSVLVNEDGAWIHTDKTVWNEGLPVHEGSVDAYYRGYFKCQDIISAGGTNEVQTETIDGDVDGGTRTLSFGGFTTAPIAWNASNSDIQAAILLLPIFAAGDVVVAGSGPYTYTFGGAYAGANVPLIQVDPSALTDSTVPVDDGSVIVETTPGEGLLTGVGSLLRGTASNGIMQLNVGGPA